MWKPVQNKSPDLFNFIENLSFDWGEFVELLELFSNMSITAKSETVDDLLADVACEWLNHDVHDEYANTSRPWFQNYHVTVRNKLFIGKS